MSGDLRILLRVALGEAGDKLLRYVEGFDFEAALALLSARRSPAESPVPAKTASVFERIQ